MVSHVKLSANFRRPHRPGHTHPIASGHSEVQHCGIVGMFQQQPERVFPIPCIVHDMWRCPQVADEVGADFCIVFS